MSLRRVRRTAAVSALAGLFGLTLASVQPQSATADANTGSGSTTDVAANPGSADDTYVNPVSASFGDTFADPVVVRGHDGAWYGFATADPLAEGDSPWQRIPMARSPDLVDWEFIGPAFDSDDAPPYATSDTLYWAPDVRYVDGRWLMYVFVTDTVDPETGEPAGDAIAAATADTPGGGWEWVDEPVLGGYVGGHVSDARARGCCWSDDRDAGVPFGARGGRHQRWRASGNRWRCAYDGVDSRRARRRGLAQPRRPRPR